MNALALALKCHAEKLWELGKQYEREGEKELPTTCYKLARETAAECDLIASKPDNYGVNKLSATTNQ